LPGSISILGVSGVDGIECTPWRGSCAYSGQKIG